MSEEQAEFNRYLCEQVRELGRECVRLQRRLAEGKAGDARDDSGDDDDDSSGDDDAYEYDDRSSARRGGGSARPPSRARPPRRSSPGRARSSRGCRAELDERGAEIARLHAACRQHESEQARLRASTDEWSAHAARLERRLERAERGSAGGGQRSGRDEGHRNVS